MTDTLFYVLEHGRDEMTMNECEYSSVFQQLLLVELFGFPWKPFTHKSFSCFLVEMRNLIKAFNWCYFTFKSCHRVSMVQPFQAFSPVVTVKRWIRTPLVISHAVLVMLLLLALFLSLTKVSLPVNFFLQRIPELLTWLVNSQGKRQGSLVSLIFSAYF